MEPGIGKYEESCFPVESLDSFISLVEGHLERNTEPNLAFLSILFGYLEHELTVSRANTAEHNSETDTDKNLAEATASLEKQCEDNEFPFLELKVVKGLYEQFALLLKANVDKSNATFTTEDGHATSYVCKFVSNLIWNGLLRSYHKDKPHIQSIFSYFTGRQLDCFGLALTVVAACQLLDYKDVNLVMSGDHAWVAYGEEPKLMVEVTWHGKGHEDKRGFLIDETCTNKSWIYHSGKPVVCDRRMEFVAMLISLNSSIDVHTDSSELQLIQQKLLYKMYKDGHMDRYPMALGTFGELQEGNTLMGCDEILPIDLHLKAVGIVQTLYDDLHVFPYCSKGHFHMRNGQYKQAMEAWAKAAQVMSKYNYGKDDEEIYKEMIDIANDLIPHCLKEDGKLSDDAECYQDLIKFYDGVCLWEEDSSTPILHSWWARFFALSVGRFSSEVRESFRGPEDPNASKIAPQEEVVRRSSRTLASPSVRGDSEEFAHAKSDSRGFASPRSSTSEESLKSPNHEPESLLGLRSHKMKALKAILTSGRKLNTQAVGLLLTAQSQVHFVKRRSNVGDYGIEYAGGATKRSKTAEAGKSAG